MGTTRIALHPAHPERICWGCDKYCPAEDLACGNGTIRTVRPAELFGDDWLDWEQHRLAAVSRPAEIPPRRSPDPSLSPGCQDD